MMKTSAWFLAIMLWASAAQALPSPETGAPESLTPWQSWVLHGYEEQYLCPDVGGERHQCLWPISLSLRLNDQGGSFTAAFELRKEGEAPLPGGPGAWPESLQTGDGTGVPVLGMIHPEVWLPAGNHTLTGVFNWDRLPETIDLPLGFILDLQVNGRPLDFPAMEVDYQSGLARLWLSKTEEPAPETEAAADSLTLTVNRLLQDFQPMMIRSRFRLAVSGRPREIVLNNVLLPDTKAVFLSSPLPSQLTAEGLRVRVKPGVYEISLDSRSLNRSESVGPVSKDSPVIEYWAFEAMSELRDVEISGAEQIDASQADIYAQWRNFPLYAIEPGASLTFTTIRRGDPEPAPDQLRLARECWLDYDGQGLTCRDRLGGTMRRQWHLNADAPFTLTQASLAGQPQVITWQTNSKGEKAPGLQLREGRLDLQADLRIDDFQGRMPASGWDHKLETRGQKLNLPPGYRLWHVSGADVGGSYGAGAWTSAWGALDFFIILIITIAMGKLYGAPGGLLALAALVLCFHEPGSPRLIFMPLLACAALLRLLPAKGKISWLVRACRAVCGLVLVVLAALFLIDQARAALYPQLDSRVSSHWSFPMIGAASKSAYYEDRYEYDSVPSEEVLYEMPAAAPAPPAALQNDMETMRTRGKKQLEVVAGNHVDSSRIQASRSNLMRSSYFDKVDVHGGGLSLQTRYMESSNRMVRLNQAPDAKVQNSAPRPAWNWRAVTLNFNESVTADQEVKLYLAGPTVNRILGLLRIILMTAFTLAIMRTKSLGPVARGLKSASVVAVLLAALTLTMPTSASAQEGFPDQELLNQYRQRLLERKPIPEPSLAEVILSAEAEKLTLVFTVSAGQESILTLPTLDQDIFRLERVRLSDAANTGEHSETAVDGPDRPLIEDQGRWLTLVPAGTHRLLIQGRLKKPSSSFQAFQINFPQSARPQKVVIEESRWWQVEGLERDGQLVSGALYLTAQSQAEADGKDGDPEEESSAGVILDPFFLVQRTISLGLEWRVHTTVKRITPAGAPVSLKLPLLPGENPTGNFRRDEGRVTLNFDPQAEEVHWESSLDITPDIELTAEDGPWTETWSLDVSPIWRVEHRGLTPIHNVNQGFWQPRWRPWPGEKLSLTIDRPQAVPGQYLVIDRGALAVSAGENNQLSNLNFQVRTSQGGPYSFSLPVGAEVREFKVDGRSVPLTPSTSLTADEAAARAGSGTPTLTAPLSAGEHDIQVSWTLDRPLSAVTRTPSLNLGAPTANLHVSLVMPENRWIIWAWGPLQGPAVLFWPLLAVVLLAAVILSRAGNTPLGWLTWFLLGVGLIQLGVLGAFIVAGWLLMLGRRRNKPAEGVFKFNFIQILLVFWTIIALWLIYKGIENGLLQNPDMLIAGGGSYGQHLSWFTDRSSGPWPTGSVLSVSSWLYKALMLAWSLWLAVSLVKWLKWGWAAFSSGHLWKKRPPRASRKKRSDGEDPQNPDGETSTGIIDKSRQS